MADETPNVTITDHPDESRIVATVGDEDEVVGFVEYRRVGTKKIIVTHTEALREGIGLGSTLARASVDLAVKEDRTLVPACPFLRGWLEKHPDAGARVDTTGL